MALPFLYCLILIQDLKSYTWFFIGHPLFTTQHKAVI